MSTEITDQIQRPPAWTRRHLLDLESLSVEELTAILDTAATFKRVTDGCRRKLPLLAGKTTANLFFENSTRTRTSFGLAARRLGADVVEFTASSSSLSKGETFVDTAKNIESMNIDVMIMRHRTPGTPRLLAEHVDCAVVNAGDAFKLVSQYDLKEDHETNKRPRNRTLRYQTHQPEPTIRL